MKRRRTGLSKRTGGFKKPRPAANARAGGRRALNQRIDGFLGIELKFYDTSLIAAALTAPTDASGGEHNPSATISLNTVVQGDGESNRDGRQISMRKISIQGTIRVPAQINVTASDEGSLIYIALVHDSQTNAALLNSEDVFKNPGANSATAANPFRNLQFTKRFRVLAHRTIVMQNPSQVWDGTNIEVNGLVRKFSMHVDLKGMVTNYSNTTETIANITDNGLNIVAYASNTQLAPVLNYNARLRFVG